MLSFINKYMAKSVKCNAKEVHVMHVIADQHQNAVDGMTQDMLIFLTWRYSEVNVRKCFLFPVLPKGLEQLFRLVLMPAWKKYNIRNTFVSSAYKTFGNAIYIISKVRKEMKFICESFQMWHNVFSVSIWTESRIWKINFNFDYYYLVLRMFYCSLYSCTCKVCQTKCCLTP